ncbi:MAG TPA: TlyA family RNA methyltransferase [Terriglobales bacterium]|jgi:23S rRNA (cytidine1920-2'-O)/16S rRNA (cytidine1409-2'-O)-methyltransferase|nr:TlyA family RNA methyltransferase [Terriglobales bacterium]
MKVRVDKLLVDRGLVETRTRAQALILAGKVLVNEQKIEKAGVQVDADSSLRILGETLRYVSRGGLKLEHALDYWRIDVNDCTCLDVGASTGGFTDCLLQHGAMRVIAVDTGYGQIDVKLRQDPRVRLVEKLNARYMKAEDVGENVDLIVIDVSFISATLVVPAVVSAAFGESVDGKKIIILVKPQFEAGREQVGKGGIVRDESVQMAAVRKVQDFLREVGCRQTEWTESPITGAEGNREFLLLGKW